MKFGENLEKVKDLLNEELVVKIIKDNNNKIKDNGDFIWTMIMLNKFL